MRFLSQVTDKDAVIASLRAVLRELHSASSAPQPRTDVPAPQSTRSDDEEDEEEDEDEGGTRGGRVVDEFNPEVAQLRSTLKLLQVSSRVACL